MRTLTALRPTAILGPIAIAALPFGAPAMVHAQGAQPQPPTISGNPQMGARLIERAGCGACHLIPGIAGASGLVGPPLTHMGNRIYVAGVLRNTPSNMITWLMEPQKVVPGNAMPDMSLTRKQARDIAAYLYTLR
ncbi:MAG TPA: c-type cytochrome [Pseudolabrys sp.]|nr:c-type cytochrome [Pseudolabrys sp.]